MSPAAMSLLLSATDLNFRQIFETSKPVDPSNLLWYGP